MKDARSRTEARRLRAHGKTHREIADQLSISPSTAHLWTKNIRISPKQKEAIEKRRNRHLMSVTEKKQIGQRLKLYQFKNKYSNSDLLKRICDFVKKHGRIPLKREFNASRIYRTKFGSWNNAIRQAGFETNPVLFAKKFKAIDGHICDSFTEKIIDDWLSVNHISHERHTRYGKTKFTADFKIADSIFVEFFGLAGVQKQYDANIKKKRILAQKLGYQLIEIYPDDIYPKNKLPTKLSVIA